QTEQDLKESGIASIILRYANVYGPRQGTVGEGGVVAIFCKKLAHTEPLKIFGDGKQTRDFVYVSDVAAANCAALSSTQNFGIYNIATGAETSVNELADLLLSLSQKDTTMEHTERVAGEVLRSSLDAAAAVQTLGWEAGVSTKEGLEETWQWFKNASF
ncbi:MAG: NAD-dependent epimerase/dehydratase family protein, partial [Patescibacteria group bacterium]|nr:NAD-dependent epimerase/dehydratase family protein [Patescibacteria group bacterium]